jgi:hypothetical protein
MLKFCIFNLNYSHYSIHSSFSGCKTNKTNSEILTLFKILIIKHFNLQIVDAPIVSIGYF